MRKQGVFIVLTMLLFTLGAVAQTPAGKRSSTTTTTTTTTTQTTATGPEHAIEGCIVQEGSDFFLIPERGRPFKLQSNADLNGQQGHKAMVSGKEISLSSSGASTVPSASGAAGTAASTTSTAGGTSAPNAARVSGTGSDLHNLANRALIVDGVKSISNTCPVNWNPSVSRPSH